MVTVQHPWGPVGLGNHFFMYSYVRLLASNLGLKLYTPEISFIEMKIGNPTLNYKFEDCEGIDNSGNEVFGFDDGISYQFQPWENALNFFSTKKDFVLVSCGYHCNYDLIKENKDTVKSYFKDFVSNEIMDEYDVAIHLRNSLVDPRFKLPEEYYLKQIKKLKAKRVFLFAENYDRHSSLIHKINKQRKLEVVIKNLNVPSSMREITKFKKIICSQGSFSFWSSFLSNAEKIIWPVSKDGPNRIGASGNVNYFVNDEDRYQHVYL